MKPSLRVLWLLLAMLVMLSSSALALRPTTEQRLLQRVQQRALRVGDRGEVVAELQRLLMEAGIETGPVDGIFGPLTERGVRSAQQRYGLEVDGLAGRLTVAALRQGQVAGGAVETAAGSGLMIFQAGAVAGPPVQAKESRPIEVSRFARLALLGADDLGGPGRSVPALAQTLTETAPVAQERVALTFNGLPGDSAALAQLLAALAEHGMQATFFVTGRQAEQSPELLQALRDSGHEIGSLGYAEIDMRTLSDTSVRAQLRRTNLLIAGETGVAPRYFRPPGGRFDRHLSELVAGEAMQMVLWSNITGRASADSEPAKVVEQIGKGLFPGAVLMLPLDWPTALEAAEPLLAEMEARGYSSVTLSRVLGEGSAK